MYTFTRSIIIHAEQEEVFLFHTNVDNLLKITPSFIHVSVLHADAAGLGQEVILEIRHLGFIPSRMHMKFIEYSYPHALSDMQLEGPFSSMIQRRLFEDIGGGYTRMIDTFEYELPLGILGKIAHAVFVKRIIERMFTHRQNTTKSLLEQC